MALRRLLISTMSAISCIAPGVGGCGGAARPGICGPNSPCGGGGCAGAPGGGARPGPPGGNGRDMLNALFRSLRHLAHAERTAFSVAFHLQAWAFLVRTAELRTDFESCHISSRK